KAKDVLADHMEIRGPEPLEAVARLIRMADRGDVVGQCVQPDVHDVIWISRNRNSPPESGSADGKIAQSPLHKGDHFVAPAFWTDEIRVCLVMRQQAVLPGRKAEKVGRFLDPLDLGT